MTDRTKDSIAEMTNFIKMVKNKRDAGNFLAPKKPSLGRGLSALLGDSVPKSISDNIDPEEDIFTQVINIKISDCVPSKYQARTNFDEESLQELANSIKDKGLIQPIAVRKVSSSPLKYEIIAGERRCRASKLAGLEVIPAIIMDLSDKEVMEVGLIENLQRRDLNPVEEAMAYNSLYNDFGYTHEQIGTAVGKSRSYVTNYLRILNLPNEVLHYIQKGELTAGHAKMLVNVQDPIVLAKKIVEGNLSVNETENLTKQVKDKNSQEKAKKIKNLPSNEDILSWYNQANSNYKNLKVSISAKTEKSGEIKITYKDIEELKSILKL